MILSNRGCLFQFNDNWFQVAQEIDLQNNSASSSLETSAKIQEVFSQIKEGKEESGHTGNVQFVIRNSDQEIFALKKSKKRSFDQWFVLEARVLRYLNTREDRVGVIQLLGAYHLNHTKEPVLLLEKAECNLLSWTEAGGEVKDLPKQMMGALDFLKKANIVHSDIKPENIVVVKTAEGRSLFKLIDFESSRSASGNDFQGRHSGTIHYMSPETLKDFETLQNGPRRLPHDMWSLGCVITEIFLGLCQKSDYLFPEEDREDLLLHQICKLGCYPEKEFPQWMTENCPRVMGAYPQEIEGSLCLSRQFSQVLGEDPSFQKMYELARDMLTIDENRRLLPEEGILRVEELLL